MRFRALLSALLLSLFAAPAAIPARADEGMWPFNNVPRAEIKRRYGFDVTDSWLNKVQRASVRFNNGGSGSFVSADGLVMTNHHIASDTLHKLSTAEKDYVKEGFYARSQSEELRAPALELNVLVSIQDVTERINTAVKPGMAASDANNARGAEVAEIEKESVADSGLRSDVVTLYQGGQYNLYRYKRYTDVRLVFAPEIDIAFFGGDPDNFNFPRYCLDMAFFRVYENNKPIKVDSYFKWSKRGAADGELVFVTGHPGSTARLNTVAHLEYLRDTGIPFVIKWLSSSLRSLREFSRQGDEQTRRAQEEILSLENSLKAYQGQYEGLQDSELMARKAAAERALRQSVAADPKKQKEYGDAWDEIAKGRKALPDYYHEFIFLESGIAFDSVLFDKARTLVRLAAESAKPDTERLPEYTEARRPPLELNLYSPEPIYDDFEKVKLTGSLTLFGDQLGAENALVKKVLAGKTAEQRASELIEGTKLKDVEYRKKLAAGGVRALDESSDPMIELAQMVDEQARTVRKRYENEVIANERANYAKIARALFDVEGTKLYPDATFTLRLSYGAVKGYEEGGAYVKPFTTFAGLYARAAKFDGEPPYRLPERWIAKKSAIQLGTPFNFVSTNDIIGGNSGSPTINKNAEIVGLIFDGNIQSLVGNFIYDQSQNRAVSVDSRGMLEALRNVYEAKELVRELTR